MLASFSSQLKMETRCYFSFTQYPVFFFVILTLHGIPSVTCERLTISQQGSSRGTFVGCSLIFLEHISPFCGSH